MRRFILLLLASLSCRSVVAVDLDPSHLMWVSPLYTMPAWWYEAPKANMTALGSSFLTEHGTPGTDGSVGVASPGQPSGYGGSSKTNEDAFQFKAQCACTLAQLPEIDGCGYCVFWFHLFYRDSPSSEYQMWTYRVTHGRNGYVSWEAEIPTSGGFFRRYTYSGGFWASAGNGLLADGTPWQLKFAARAALDSLLSNANLYMSLFVTSETKVVDQVGATQEGKIRAALVRLQSSLTSQVDMKPYVPRCASQDVEVTATIAGFTDHVLDAAPGALSAYDTDGDGIPDYKDAKYDDATAVPAEMTSNAYLYTTGWVKFYPYFNFSGAGASTMRSDQFSTITIPWKKPALGGPTSFFSTTLDFNPYNNPVTAVAPALDTYRAVCRLLGVCFVGFWTVYGVLITVRQY